jgi:hypothetical protein
MGYKVAYLVKTYNIIVTSVVNNTKLYYTLCK